MRRPERPGGSASQERTAAPIRPATIDPDRQARAAQRLRRRYEKAEARRFTRRSRARRLGWLSAASTLVLAAALIATAVFSPILALRDIRVSGTVRLDPAVIAEAVAGQVGTPLALLDQDRLRSDLAAFAIIRSYTTEILPPGTLVIHLVERTPVGVVAAPSGFEIVDAAGVLIQTEPTRPTGLPVIRVDADGTDGAGFRAMAEVLLALPPEVFTQVDSVDADTRDDVTLQLVGSDQRVVWGSADRSEQKSAVLAALLGRFSGSGPGEYDVSAPGTAVFRAG